MKIKSLIKHLIFVIPYVVIIIAVGNKLEDRVNPNHESPVVPVADGVIVPDGASTETVSSVYLIDENGEITYLSKSCAGGTPKEPGQVLVTEYADGTTVETYY